MDFKTFSVSVILPVSSFSVNFCASLGWEGWGMDFTLFPAILLLNPPMFKNDGKWCDESNQIFYVICDSLKNIELVMKWKLISITTCRNLSIYNSNGHILRNSTVLPYALIENTLHVMHRFVTQAFQILNHLFKHIKSNQIKWSNGQENHLRLMSL